MLNALRCPYCKGVALIESAGAFRCQGCDAEFPRRHGVVNTLIRPDEEVIRELKGMMEEAAHRGETLGSVDDFIVRRVNHVTTQSEREASLEGQPRNYYRSTRLNVEQALEHVDLGGQQKVLEIGGENEFPFLVPFHDRGHECYVTNIYFFYDDPDRTVEHAHMVAGDMNNLPFRDGFFDIVLVSATTHHSPDLGKTIGEISRVTRPGGTVLILNEPARGVVKHLWERMNGDHGFQKGGARNDLVHENEYSLTEYRRLFRRYGLRLRRSMFSRFYDDKLRSGDVVGVRWSPLARLASLLWRVPLIRSLGTSVGLPIGQRLLGLELNFVLEKK